MDFKFVQNGNFHKCMIGIMINIKALFMRFLVIKIDFFSILVFKI